VTYGSDWSIGYMPGDLYHTVPPAPQSPNYLSNLPPARDQALQPFGLDATQLLAGGNPNDDSYRELIEPPSAGADPLAYARYWDQASVVIKIDASNNVTIGRPNSDGSITDYNVPPSNPNFAIYHPLYAMFVGAISTNQSIQDNREGAPIRLATLDVSLIENADPGGNNGNGVKYKAPNFNGIVYIFDASATSGARRGIRIKNGSKIPLNPTLGMSGLTVVSNNPVYIQGDFNTGGTGNSVPSNNPSNLNPDGTYINPTTPPNSTVPGYTRAPTSVLADAVNILSANWIDGNSGASLSSRPATSTTVNAAIISGIVPTNVYNNGGYSGGAENFPRFLEDWTSKPLTYYGSMVELFKSQQSIGEWHYGAPFYNAPAREWFFDNNFKMNPPPGSIMLYSYIKGRWFVL
jgi:hypothetical protein